jgi:AcrR family transcriptional regulator
MKKDELKPGRGRPRGFDREIALEKALDLFWRQGYEATSLAELTATMGLTPPSLYAAFGNKQQLFLQAMEHYSQTYGSSAQPAFDAAPTAREAIEALLGVAAATYASPLTPPGCPIISAATNCSPASADVESALRERRIISEAQLRQRIEQGISAGELPPDTNAAALGKFYAAVIQGMSVQARDGTTCPELAAIVATAMRAWPSSSAWP